MKELKSKWLIIALVILLVGGILFWGMNNKSVLKKYQNQSISVLKRYNKGEITNKEAGDKIEAITNKLDNEYKTNNKSSFLALKSKLGLISSKLKYGEDFGETEIKKYIQQIKQIN